MKERIVSTGEGKEGVTLPEDYLRELELIPGAEVEITIDKKKKWPRKVSAGEGHDAVLIVVAGEMSVVLNRRTFTVSAGEAFRVDGPDEACLENTGERESVYMLAAGRKDGAPSDVDGISEPSSVESNAPCVAPEGAGIADIELPELDTAGLSGLGADDAGLDETEFEITREDSGTTDYEEDFDDER
jgi:quercetin dioxygenase-like cupin family protein